MQTHLNHLNKLPIHLLKMIEKPLKQPHPQPRIQTPRRRPNTMHTQLRQPGINRPHARRSRQHRPHRPPTATIIANLKDLQRGATPVRDAPQQRRRHGVGRHVSVGVGRDGDADVQPGRVVFEVLAEEVRVDGVGDVGGDEEAVGVGLR